MKRRIAVLLLALVAACGGDGAKRAKSPDGGEEAWAWPAVDKPALVDQEGAKDAAVVVAIENYAYVATIPGATQNGADWYNYFALSRKIPIERVRLVTNANGDKETIEKELRNAAEAAEPGGTLWFVFIGHGAPLLFDGKTEGVLIGEDAKQTADSLAARRGRQSEVSKLMGASKASHKLALLDACFSGKSAAGSLAPGLQPTLVVPSAAALGAVTWLSAGAGNQFAGPLPGANRPAFSYLVLGAMRGWAAEGGVVTAKRAVAYAKRSLAAMEPKMGRAQTPELAGEDAPLAHGAEEKGPDLAAMLSGAALASAGSGAKKKEGPNFGEGLGSVTDVPSVGGLPELPALGSLAGVDDKLLDVVQAAKRADKNDRLSPEEKAAAWEGLAKYEGENPYQRAAEARREQWKKVGAAEKKRREQIAKVCAQHGKDDAKLAHLLGLDDDVVTPAQKSQYKDELAKAYAPWEKELKECGSEGVAPVASGGGCPAGMAAIAGGHFMMGADDVGSAAKPVHPVDVAAFCMDKTEVTAAAYGACVKQGKCSEPNSDGYCNWGKGDRDNHPINCVDWNQATAFCAASGKRLPTEEEWEYAARGSDGRDYPWGNEAPGSQLCWNRQGQGTCPVGQFSAGKFGLFDMAGNVWEWTTSGYSDDYNATRQTEARVNRGGGWFDVVPGYVRAARRFRNPATDRHDYLGLRCAR